MIVFLALGIASPNGRAQSQNTFEMTMAPTVTCMSLMSIPYMRGWLREFLNEPYKHEGGANWFNASSHTLFGLPLQDVFISDGSSEYMFVGVLFKAPVDKVMAAVDAAGSGKFVPGDAPGKYLSASGAVALAYQGTMSKLYCAGTVNSR